MAVNEAAVHANLDAVRARIERAARTAGREPSDVRLVAVSKHHDSQAIRAAYAHGQRDFGENYVQELVAKAAELADLADLRWHFIGHLQRNKAKAVVATGAAIQTVDSGRLAAALAAAHTALAPLDVHIQVNVAREPQKGGCAPEELPGLVAEVRALAGIRLAGLMTIPPVGEPDGARPFYQALRELAHAHGLASLSMGMTDDLEVAVEEGASIVRVGTAIFGARA